MKLASILRPALVGLLIATANGQDNRMPFPMEPSSSNQVQHGIAMRPVWDQVSALKEYQAVLLEGLPTPYGGDMEVELEQLDLSRLKLGFQVDGRERPDLLVGLDLSVWRGTVVGIPSSYVLLSFSRAGCRGWVEFPGMTLHLIGSPDESGDWRRSETILITEQALLELGSGLGPYCDSNSLYPPAEDMVVPQVPQGPLPLGSGCGLRECKIAVETDYQLHQLFGDLGAQTSYITTLLAAVSDRYEGQIDTVLTFPYIQFYTFPDDPWIAPDLPGTGTLNLLTEFRNSWLGKIPGDADLAHFLSGADLGGGIAYLDVLCNPDFAFAVSANLNGSVSFPITQQSGNWDFMVIAHELGHNFSAPHTHEFNPPIDNCAGGIHTSNGTVMSYCHLCPGGTANVTTFFHPQNVQRMTEASEECLGSFGGSISGENVDLLNQFLTTQVTATVVGDTAGPVQLNYRYGGGAFQVVDMTHLGDGEYVAELPAAGCGDVPEYYYSYMDTNCGLTVDPPSAPAVVYGALVGTFDSSYVEDFESGTGWTQDTVGATSGQWQRGVPVDDPKWPYDPVADYDGSGSAYLTQNEVGNTDVDDGAVRLFSPILDMSGAGASLRYAYYFRNTNDPGSVDALIVEINDNGGVGEWFEIARHDVDGGLAWRTHFVGNDDIITAGATPTSTVQIRFVANDGDPGSIVEAGVDSVEIVTLECGAEPGTASCFGVGCPCGNDDPAAGCATSTGSGARLLATGTGSVAADDLALYALDVPPDNQGLCYMGDQAVQSPFFDGFQCALGTTFRFLDSIQGSGSSGTMSYTGVVAASGLPTAGSTWHFHFWFRDVPGTPCGTGANLTNLYSVTFSP